MNSNEERRSLQAEKTLAAWQASAQYWDKYRDSITRMFAPLTAALIEEAQIAPGKKVLDIGGGSGEPSLSISQIVGPTGSVTFTDPVAGMVETAQAEAGRRGLTNIQFKQCSADQLPFADSSFDAVVGRLSAMFFPDPGAALREVLRVVRHDGLVSFVVWSAEEANPFFTTVNEVIDRFVDSPPEDPDAPDAFRFADPGKFAGLLKNAGASNVTERSLNFQIEEKLAFEEFWQLRTEMSETLRRKLAGVASAQIPIIRQAVAEAAQKYFRNGRMSFPAEALVVTGKRSSPSTSAGHG